MNGTQHIPVAQSYYIHITAHFCMNPLQNRNSRTDCSFSSRMQVGLHADRHWHVLGYVEMYLECIYKFTLVWLSCEILEHSSRVLQYSHQSSELSHAEQPLSSHHTTRAQPLIRPANEIHPNGCLKWELRKRVGERHRLVEGLHSNRTV